MKATQLFIISLILTPSLLWIPKYTESDLQTLFKKKYSLTDENFEKSKKDI